MKNFIKSWDELGKIPTFEGRIEYLRTYSTVGEPTFGYDRWINQAFYNSEEWRRVRREVVLRDTIGRECCDLGIEKFPIRGRILVHHMVPLLVGDIAESSEFLLNPEYLICCSDNTHRAIHYGDARLLPQDYTPRSLFDTCPWKH